MSPTLTFDPYELMPFTGYIDPATGRQVRYLSLAHFIHSERVSGVDEHYRKYLLQLDDPELFRLEVDGVAITSGERSNWGDMKGSLLYAGIFMQALSNRERYSQYIEIVDQLSVASCSFSDDAAAVLGQFIGDIKDPQDALKVVFLGDNRNEEYIKSCLSTVFAKRAPFVCSRSKTTVVRRAFQLLHERAPRLTRCSMLLSVMTLLRKTSSAAARTYSTSKAVMTPS